MTANEIKREAYTKEVVEHATHPRNRGVMENPDAKGLGGSPCGDQMEFYIKIGKKKVGGKEQDYIKEVKFETMGCAAAIASASVTSELVKGKTLEEAKKITEEEVRNILGSLPLVKFHCCGLTMSALQNAIANWENAHKHTG